MTQRSKICTCGFANGMGSDCVCDLPVKSETVSPANARDAELRGIAERLADQPLSYQCLLSLLRSIDEDASQAIGAAAKEAAEEIVNRLDLDESFEVHIARYISAAIEKARTK